MTTEKFQLIHADCLDAMNDMPANSIDAIITDPPYGLNFMGKNWDHGIPGPAFWQAALRVAKPGAHLLAFGGTRTFHRLAAAIEDAGWEIRDCLVWCYGSGFPKSLDVSKALDKVAGVEREVVGAGKYANRKRTAHQKTNSLGAYSSSENDTITAPATAAAKHWHGWGTALKPAWEPVIMARKPLEGTVADNVLKYGCGGVNVDGCRVETEDDTGRKNKHGPYESARTWSTSNTGSQDSKGHGKGRYPANLLHDGSAEVLGCFPETTQIDNRRHKIQHQPPGQNGIYGTFDGADNTPAYNDTGTAARFFQTCTPDAKRLIYCGKASKRDRDGGCGGMDERIKGSNFGNDGARPHTSPDYRYEGRSRNHHPTVKPTTLMQYLCRLITPPDGVILDPFTGSGSTGKAALAEGFRFIGIEKEAEYIEIARARLSCSADTPRQLSLF